MATDRTEKATPKRRQDARKRGQIARRPELAAAISFLAALVMLRVAGDDIIRRAGQFLVKMITHAPDATSFTPSAVHQLLIDAIYCLAMLALPVIAAALVAGLAGNFAQGGLTLTPAALKPQADRFNPAANLKRVFGGNSAVELLKSLLKLGGIVAVCYGVFERAVAQAPAMVGLPAGQTFIALGRLAYDLGLRAGAVLFIVAALDYAYGWYQHEKSIRMTKQEVKQEFKEQEGDPLVKNQRRRAARALISRRMAAEVARADVVITNPTHYAVALRYDQEKDSAPLVVAKGQDEMAKRIRAIAKENEVAVIENPPLARALYAAVEVGRAIPSEFFRAVAEILAYVFRQRERVVK
jgi:flagellar biosynthetic protein FlhB